MNQSISFLRPVLPDGRELVAEGRVIRDGKFLVSSAELTDADGDCVAVGFQTSTFMRRHTAVDLGTRVLATILFTDIVSSTKRATQLGDTDWQELLEHHNSLVRRQLQLFAGREVKCTGDGFLVTFESPARAIQCAKAIREGVKHLGLEIRAGLHIGEVEVHKGELCGIVVHVASRVHSAAGSDEILVSSTLREIVSGSGFSFQERGDHELKGIEGTHRLFAVTE